MFFLPDQHRPDWMPFNRSLPLRMPAVQRLMEAGTTFTNAFTPSAGIPLVIAGPGVRRGVMTDALVVLHDLAATFLDLAGATALPDSDARSLRPVLAGQRNRHRPVVRSGLGRWDLVYDGRYKLVAGEENGPLLFDVQADPHETINLAAQDPRRVAQLLNTPD